MKVKVTRKGHWHKGEFIPVGGTFEMEGDVIPEGMEDRLVSADAKAAEETTPDSEGDGAPVLDWGALPQDIIGKLQGAGLDTPSKVAATSDDSLLAIDGIGPATVKAIRAQVKGA